MKISREDLELLREAVGRHKPSLMSVVDLVGKVALTDGQRENLRMALADDLCSTGLRPDSEPNEHGLKLDAIIGKLMYY
jgi:hypothetical protein